MCEQEVAEAEARSALWYNMRYLGCGCECSSHA
eukprot:SAG11_NODE_15499_length_576_cov_0.907757_2_plen_32_part_01